MNNNKLPATIAMGPVHLTISDLERSTAFYRDALGLIVRERTAGAAALGAGQRELLRLVEDREARHVPWRTGLYHFALLLPSRKDLGSVLRNMVAGGTRLTGGADHLVSEAIYLDDPDGNGIELYRDRPRSEWPYDNGRLIMDTLPLDFEGILAEAGEEMPAPFRLHEGTIMGHVHLHVAGIDEAVSFYRDIIGLDLQLRMMQSAAFLSAGGYHHHLGVNTWAGVGAPPPPEHAAGLRRYEVVLPDRSAYYALIGRLRDAQWPFDDAGTTLLVRDPSQNAVEFSTVSAGQSSAGT